VHPKAAFPHDVAQDGRFLVRKLQAEGDVSTSVSLLVNWPATLAASKDKPLSQAPSQ
jgi:hypothetical protein